MIHDITHCKNSSCVKRDTCYRYLAYKEAIDMELMRISVLVNKPEDNNACSLYWEHKQNKKDETV